jgi:hypothetical protein
VTDSALPESGPEREIFLKALRLFSDECEPPDLIAECPFSIDLPGGGRGCGEECLELLSRYGVPRSTGGIPIGNSEVAAHPMGRPRRPKSHVSSGKPFDAAESFYRDSDDPDRSTWSTVSLLYALKNVYLPTSDALIDPSRCEKLSAAASELRQRQFNVDELLRCGLRLRLTNTLAIAIVMPDLLAAGQPQRNGEDESAQPSELFAPAPEGWPELLDEYLAAKDPLTPGLSKMEVVLFKLSTVVASEFRARLRLWAGMAPIDDLANWRPPTIDEFLAYDLGNESAIKAECRRPVWMIDRFTETYLKDWDTDSLRLEWRYQQGSDEPPCSQRELAARLIDSNDLARTLAHAAANPVSDALLEIKNTAVRLLVSGRRDTAAAMFDAARQDNWDDPELQNNYGFCLLPDDALEALKALDLAAKLGFSPTVNICNRVLALFKLGRHATALEVADQAVERWSDLDFAPSVLWDFTASEPKLLTRAHPRWYLLELATYVADASGNELVAARWHDLKSRLERDAGR